MARYRALAKTWLSHLNRMVQDGEEFETEFPLVDGKPMRLGANLELIEPEQVAPAPGKGKNNKSSEAEAASENLV